MFSMSGVNKQRFIDHVKADPHTQRLGLWPVDDRDHGQRMGMLAIPEKAFEKAEAGLIPKHRYDFGYLGRALRYG